jgi:D-alanyl-D-alanine carboxypeptidase/D-alanyl-D-alanine-endopeptidase (penicillin-binding protein 4)
MTRGFAFAATLLFACAAAAELPRPVDQAFVDAQVPLHSVALVVQEVGAAQPLFAHNPARPMNPASVMKLVTTFAALELLGRDYRWKTEAYLGGPLDGGVLRGDLIIKGYGDPKLTIEQWQAFMATLRAKGLDRVAGDLGVDRTWFKPARHDPAAFDKEPLKPYNVGPDALLVSFNSVRFVFAPNAAGDAVELRAEPPLAEVALGAPPRIGAGDCGDWRSAVGAKFVNRGASASASFAGSFAASCGERDWYVALLDHPHFAYAMFSTYFREAGGLFNGGLRDVQAPTGIAPFATLESPPLYDIVRDVNKL